VHPIGIVAERTGLSADVLRVWERRYRVVEPRRDEAGRRVYSDADVERLRLLARATAGGRSIGQVCGFSTAELAALVRGDEAGRRTAAAHAPEPAVSPVVRQALERVADFDAVGLDGVLRRAASTLGLPVFVESVAAPLLREIGERWRGGELSPGQEHLATAVIRFVLSGSLGFGSAGAASRSLVVATLQGERHEIGALLVAAVAAGEGWRVTYLGPDLPAEEIQRVAEMTSAQAVAVSIVYPDDEEGTLAAMAALRAGLPADVMLLAGGPGAARLQPALAREGIEVLGSLAELRAVLRGGE
jgi:MerR family transcriptional regulator, light-induced transcriptional regulator